MRKNYRGGRLGEEIKHLISDMLLKDLRDPRFSGLVSVTAVKADPDGSFATVYVSKLGLDPGAAADEADKQGVIDAFTAAKGLIRKEISGRLRLRHSPDLRFRFDESEEYGRHIEKIIDDLGLTGAAITDSESDSPESGDAEESADEWEEDAEERKQEDIGE